MTQLFPFSLLGFSLHGVCQADAAFNGRPFSVKIHHGFELAHARIVLEPLAQQFQVVLGLAKGCMHELRSLPISQKDGFGQALKYGIGENHLIESGLVVPTGAAAAGNHPGETFDNPERRHLFHEGCFCLVNPFGYFLGFDVLISKVSKLDGFVNHLFNSCVQRWLERHVVPFWIPLRMTIRHGGFTASGWVSRLAYGGLA